VYLPLVPSVTVATYRYMLP